MVKAGKGKRNKMKLPGQNKQTEDAGPTAKILKGPVQLSASFALIILASVPDLAPLRMVAAELWVYT